MFSKVSTLWKHLPWEPLLLPGPEKMYREGRVSAPAIFIDINIHIDQVSEIREKHFSILETRTRISHIQSRTSRPEPDF